MQKPWATSNWRRWYCMADQNLMLVFCLRYSINFGNIWNNSGNGLKCSPKPWQSLHCLKHGCRHSLLWHDVQIVSICCRWLIRLTKSNFVILLSGFLFFCLRTHCTLFGNMPSSLWIILLVQNNNFIFFLSFHIFTDSAKETGANSLVVQNMLLQNCLLCVGVKQMST